MDWLHVITIAGSTIGACLYFRRETKQQLDKIDQHLDKIDQQSKERDLEMKDFHGRMCVLEERYLQMMQRILERKEG